MGIQISSDDIWAVLRGRLRQYLVDVEWDTTHVVVFTRTKLESIGSWVIGFQPPLAQPMTRLWHALAELGYDSPELQGLDEFNYYCGRLWAFGVVDMDTLCTDILNIRNTQTALQIMRGQQPLAPKLTLNELRELYDVELDAKLAELPRVNRPAVAQAVAAPVAARADAEPQDNHVAPAVVPQVLFTMDPSTMLAVLVGAALPLTRQMLSDQVSPAQRSAWRELAGTETVFGLANAMSRLCSERARTEMR